MTRRVQKPPGTIVVTNHRPQIRITTNNEDLVSLVVPGIRRESLALAHAIVSEFLSEISDDLNLQIHAPKIEPGDSLLTCLLVTIELQRYDVNPPAKARGSVRRLKLDLLAKTLREAAARVCMPRWPSYDVTEVSI